VVTLQPNVVDESLGNLSIQQLIALEVALGRDLLHVAHVDNWNAAMIPEAKVMGPAPRTSGHALATNSFADGVEVERDDQAS
jgi:hypothetical protein